MKFFRCFLFLFVAVLFSSNANAQAIKFLQNDIRQLKSDVEILQRSVYRSADTSKENSGDVLIKLGEMESLFAASTGKIEEFEHRLKTLEEKLDMINKDMDLRFTMLEEKVSINNLEHKKATTPPVKENTKPDEKIEGSVEDIYKNGLDAINNFQADTAISIFTHILKKYPSHQLAPNAQYWLGEAYYSKKEFDKAAVTFAKGYSDYKTSPKAGDCLLKLGMTMVELKKPAEGCAAFLNLPKEFPTASESLKKKAEFQVNKNSCK